VSLRDEDGADEVYVFQGNAELRAPVIRQAVHSQTADHQSSTVNVSRLARSALETQQLPRRASFFKGLATFFIGLATTELVFLFAMAITITTIQIAGR
jgi:hypothetical protein